MAKEATAAGEKKKRSRSPSGPKKIYAIVRVIDRDGQMVELDGAKVDLVSFERSADAVLTKIGPGGAAAGCMLLQGMLPASGKATA